jgi:Trypsin-co-occurring domain 1
MGRTEIVEVEMPDGTVINAEVVVSDSITDVAAGSRLKLDDAKDSIASFVRWAVGALAVPAEGVAPEPVPGSVSPQGMNLSRVGLEFGLNLAVKSGMLTSAIASVGGEASVVIRLEWERPTASSSER